MRRRTFVGAAAGSALAARALAMAQTDSATPTVRSGDTVVATTAPRTGYAPVNGLDMYYEIHGDGGVPLLVLHGAFGSTGMFGALVPALAESRQVVVVDQQAHGRTADVNPPSASPRWRRTPPP